MTVSTWRRRPTISRFRSNRPRKLTRQRQPVAEGCQHFASYRRAPAETDVTRRFQQPRSAEGEAGGVMQRPKGLGELPLDGGDVARFEGRGGVVHSVATLAHAAAPGCGASPRVARRSGGASRSRSPSKVSVASPARRHCTARAGTRCSKAPLPSRQTPEVVVWCTSPSGRSARISPTRRAARRRARVATRRASTLLQSRGFRSRRWGDRCPCSVVEQQGHVGCGRVGHARRRRAPYRGALTRPRAASA
jgi:hypothetical protein